MSERIILLYPCPRSIIRIPTLPHMSTVRLLTTNRASASSPMMPPIDGFYLPHTRNRDCKGKEVGVGLGICFRGVAMHLRCELNGRRKERETFGRPGREGWGWRFCSEMTVVGLRIWVCTCRDVVGEHGFSIFRKEKKERG